MLQGLAELYTAISTTLPSGIDLTWSNKRGLLVNLCGFHMSKVCNITFMRFIITSEYTIYNASINLHIRYKNIERKTTENQEYICIHKANY